MASIGSWHGPPESADLMDPPALNNMQQCLCRWLIQDTLKVLTYKLLYAFDIFQIRSGSFTGKAGHGPGTESLLGIHVRHTPSWMLYRTPLGLPHPLLCIHTCIQSCCRAFVSLILDI